MTGHNKRRESFEAAAMVVERMANKIMRKAFERHDAEEPDYDDYEALESQAALLMCAAGAIRRRGKRRY